MFEIEEGPFCRPGMVMERSVHSDARYFVRAISAIELKKKRVVVNHAKTLCFDNSWKYVGLGMMKRDERRYEIFFNKMTVIEIMEESCRT